MDKKNINSQKFLMIEYERLYHLEEINIVNYEKATRLYLTAISIFIGVVLFYFEKGEHLNLPPSIVFYTGILILVLGEITFLRMIGMDMGRLELGYALQKIRNYFINIDDGIEKSFVNRVHSHSPIFKEWSSFLGIIKRSLALAQEKTFVVIINALVFVLLLRFFFVNESKIQLLLLVISFFVFVLIHMVYASLRYKITRKNITKEIFYWV